MCVSIVSVSDQVVILTSSILFGHMMMWSTLTANSLQAVSQHAGIRTSNVVNIITLTYLILQPSPVITK